MEKGRLIWKWRGSPLLLRMVREVVAKEKEEEERRGEERSSEGLNVLRGKKLRQKDRWAQAVNNFPTLGSASLQNRAH